MFDISLMNLSGIQIEFILCNEFEKHTVKMVATTPRAQCIKYKLQVKCSKNFSPGHPLLIIYPASSPPVGGDPGFLEWGPPVAIVRGVP